VKKEGSELEENMRGLNMKVCLVDSVDFYERKNINFDMLNFDEELTSFYWHIGDRRGKLVDKQCIKEKETNLVDTLCIIGRKINLTNRMCINEDEGNLAYTPCI
jgi:hypothetical protein